MDFSFMSLLLVESFIFLYDCVYERVILYVYECDSLSFNQFVWLLLADALRCFLPFNSLIGWEKEPNNTLTLIMMTANNRVSGFGILLPKDLQSSGTNRCLTFSFLLFCNRESLMWPWLWYANKEDIELLVLLPHPAQYWDYIHAPPCPVHSVLSIKSTAPCILSKHSMNWTISTAKAITKKKL